MPDGSLAEVIELYPDQPHEDAKAVEQLLTGIEARVKPLQGSLDFGSSESRYMSEINQYPLLSQEEMVALAQAMEKGQSAMDCLKGNKPDAVTRAALEQDMQHAAAAKRLMIQCNLRLVVSLAKRYLNRGLPLADLVQEGSLGLHRAVELYDWRRGNKFSTYAGRWIRRGCSVAIDNLAKNIRHPIRAEGRQRAIASLQAEHQATHGGEPMDDVTLAGKLGADIDKLREHYGLYRQQGSLNSLLPGSESTETGDFVPDPMAEVTIEERITQLSLTDLVRTLVEGAGLSERERGVLAMRFEFFGEVYTQKEVGEHFGVSHARIGQIEEKAMKKLAECAQRMELTAEVLSLF